jgi:hypothetical protein
LSWAATRRELAWLAALIDVEDVEHALIVGLVRSTNLKLASEVVVELVDESQL